mmetsp:Transcript_45545/g.120876  ORF Transcript_45545/g.120876 Transcript_45545/m.120876 type:complete len:351 (+) Transcript_45545:1265-2317(+)
MFSPVRHERDRRHFVLVHRHSVQRRAHKLVTAQHVGHPESRARRVTSQYFLPHIGYLEEVLDASTCSPREIFHKSQRQALESVSSILQTFLELLMQSPCGVFVHGSVPAHVGCHEGSVHRIVHVHPNGIQDGGMRLPLHAPEQETLQPTHCGVGPFRNTVNLSEELGDLKTFDGPLMVIQKPLDEWPHALPDVLSVPIPVEVSGHKVLEDPMNRARRALLGADELGSKLTIELRTGPLDRNSELHLHLRGGCFQLTHGLRLREHCPQDHVFKTVTDRVDLHKLAAHDGHRHTLVLLCHVFQWHVLPHCKVQYLIFIFASRSPLDDLCDDVCYSPRSPADNNGASAFDGIA